MKIGLDIDGVILDFQATIIAYAEIYNYKVFKNQKPIKYDGVFLNEIFSWTYEQEAQFINEYFLKLSDQTNFIAGAKDVINMLKEEGNKLYIISARGLDKDEMQKSVETKFAHENLKFDGYYWKQKSKVIGCKKEKVDVMIDDNFYNCQELADNGIKVFYFRIKGAKRLIHPNVIEVGNWGEIYKKLHTEFLDKA